MPDAVLQPAPVMAKTRAWRASQRSSAIMRALVYPMRSTAKFLLLCLPLLLTTASAQRSSDPIDRIREADLKADLFALAGDHTRGREGGTLDELTASAWLAERARAAGLQPAGDNGTYFQF